MFRWLSNIWYTRICDLCGYKKICKNKIKLRVPVNFKQYLDGDSDELTVVTLSLCKECADDIEKSKGGILQNDREDKLY